MGADSDIRKDTSAPVPSICVEGGLTDSEKDQQRYTPVSMAVYGVHSRGSLSHTEAIRSWAEWPLETGTSSVKAAADSSFQDSRERAPVAWMSMACARQALLHGRLCEKS